MVISHKNREHIQRGRAWYACTPGADDVGAAANRGELPAAAEEAAAGVVDELKNVLVPLAAGMENPKVGVDDALAPLEPAEHQQAQL